MKFMHLDFDPTNAKWISKVLKLPSSFDIDGLQQLLLIDFILPAYEEVYQNKKKLEQLIKTNKLIKNL